MGPDGAFPLPVGLAFDAVTGVVRPRVLITFSPERLLAYGNVPAEVQKFRTGLQDVQKRAAVLRRLIEERGLRAQLKSGSLLTGQLYVALDYYPGAAKVKVDLRNDEVELPVVPGTFAVLETKLTSILEKIERDVGPAFCDSAGLCLGFRFRATQLRRCCG